MLDPFAEQYQIEQTIEGDIFAILRLWNTIKCDKRVEEVLSCSHSFAENKSFQRWGMQVSRWEIRHLRAERKRSTHSHTLAHTLTHTHIHTQTYTRTNIHTQTHKKIHTQTHTHTQTHKRTHKHTHTRTDTHTHTYATTVQICFAM